MAEKKKKTENKKQEKTTKVKKTEKTSKTKKEPKSTSTKVAKKTTSTKATKKPTKSSASTKTKTKKSAEKPKAKKTVKEKIIEVPQQETDNQETGIEISNDVIAVIAGVAVSEVQGVASMSGGFAGGISEVLSGKKNLAKGIKVEKNEVSAKIDVNIIVEYGTRIPDVAFEVQNRVKKAVESMTGFKVEEVNVHIQGVNTKMQKEDSEEDEENKD